MMKINKKYFIIPFVASVALSLGIFQNCSNTKLESAVEMASYQAPTLKLSGEVCPLVKEGAPNAAKFIFMVDMSASNVGDWINGPYSANSGGNNYWYWDKTKQTDVDGSRFDAIKFFLEDCAGQTGSQFSVIGFSRTAGILEGTGTSSALNCANVSFTDAASSKAQLESLKSLQTTEAETYYYPWDLATFHSLTANAIRAPVMGGTSYNSALKCAEKVLVDDLTSATATATKNYHAFLLSDGIPKDEKPVTCPTGQDPKSVQDRKDCEATNALSCEQLNFSQGQKDQCYKDKALTSTAYMRQSAFSAGKDLRIYGIYYGGLSTSTPVVLDGIAIDGGTGGAIQLKSFKDNQKKALCDLVVTKVSYEYRPDVFMAVNLTAIRRGGRLLADSDMDGLADEDEIRLGYDPRNPRSRVSGVLDSICERLGGVAKCQAKRNAITCNPNNINPTGLSECDYKILGLDHLPTAGRGDWGIDSDNDGVLDFVEILKGTDPAVADMADDSDGDGVSNLDEIVRGSDPFFNDNQTPANVLNDVSVNSLPASQGSASCPAGGWTINLNRLQVTPTLEVPMAPTLRSEFTHAQNQQMVLLIYRLSPQNSTSSQASFFGRIVRTNVKINENGTESLSTATDLIQNNEFFELGKVFP